MERVVVKKDTTGAQPFVVRDGAVTSATPDLSRKIASTIGPAGGLTPSDLASAYGFNADGGTGQTVAIVDAYNDPNIGANLTTFDTQYGLPACTVANACLKVTNQNGVATPLPPNDTTGWSVEETLDVETVHAVCELCKIDLVEATTPSDANLATAENSAANTLKATEITNSYGGAEQGLTAADIAAYNHPGVVITASTGDHGYYEYDLQSGFDQASSPASDSTVVGVGGTSLYLGQTAKRSSETVWNDNGVKDYDEQITGDALGAGGGGCSTTIAAKLWQLNLSNWPATACGIKRSTVDVSAVADYLTGYDIYDTYDPSTCSGCATGWHTYGGTSLASPLVAGMWALAGGAHGAAIPSEWLYGHLGSSSLYDVTVGGNGWCDGVGASACGDPNADGIGTVDCDYPAVGATPAAGDAECDAAPGYDGASGVGTPIGLGAFAATGPSAVISGPASIAHATIGTWKATTADPFPKGAVTKYSWSWGDGTAATITTTGTATHAYAAAGSYTITLTVTDNYGITGKATFAVKAT